MYVDPIIGFNLEAAGADSYLAYFVSLPLSSVFLFQLVDGCLRLEDILRARDVRIGGRTPLMQAHSWSTSHTER